MNRLIKVLNIISVDNLTLVQQLASDLLNYHLLRLLREDIPLPELDQTFFGRVCTIVTDIIVITKMGN